ncbi:VOC family protein [Paenibacillus sp. 481]|uniref:VOC family protein n=1 Tax=Paenibacillus sp. 481 TaxID=2835869 RepID=UPI001E533D2D|nr:VOC family protein [Paenibacillus sp. 481]UHA73709.1 hypothetical protein KIK04_00585 [Paenibacillus sp. 481]
MEQAFERALQAGATIDQGIEVMHWGERLFYMEDPFGNPLCIVDQRTIFTGSQ